LNALGKSNIHETGLAGVWLVEHFNMDGQLVGKFIEITAIPAILKSQPEDIREGLEKLTDQLK
jgi:hydrogenase-1 operon protein HyaF